MKARGVVVLGAVVCLSLVGGMAVAGPPPVRDNVFLRGGPAEPEWAAKLNGGTSSLRSGDGATDLAASSTVFQVRVLRLYNGGWAACSGCVVLVYSGTAWLGTYTTDSAGYRNITGAQYRAGTPYLLVAGWAAADNSCNNPDWNNTWSGQINAGVRKANVSSVTVYVSEIKGISNTRWNKMTPRYDNPFADNIYGTTEHPVPGPFGFENMLGHAGNTLGIYLTGPYDKPRAIGRQLAADYHVYPMQEELRDKVLNFITITWDIDGSIAGGWSVKTCNSDPVKATCIKKTESCDIPAIGYLPKISCLDDERLCYNDGYPEDPLINNVDILNPGARFIERETGTINSEISRWRR
ncbi:MAG: hypothetical protein HYV63_08930 [Candidatus Schekmanbacteria bacterium]|nr:hypothetical protein [Candidatus Schekmanbacteria bacterium]